MRAGQTTLPRFPERTDNSTSRFGQGDSPELSLSNRLEITSSIRLRNALLNPTFKDRCSLPKQPEAQEPRGDQRMLRQHPQGTTSRCLGLWGGWRTSRLLLPPRQGGAAAMHSHLPPCSSVTQTTASQRGATSCMNSLKQAQAFYCFSPRTKNS